MEQQQLSRPLLDKAYNGDRKLCDALREFGVCMKKLEVDPKNPLLLDQRQEIEHYIISVSKCQKQVFNRMRKEVVECKAQAAVNGTKFVLPKLSRLNNNHHITNNNEMPRRFESLTRGINGHADYPALDEDDDVVMMNGDLPSPISDRSLPFHRAQSSSSPELTSGDDDVMEIRKLDNNASPRKLENGSVSITPEAEVTTTKSAVVEEEEDDSEVVEIKREVKEEPMEVQELESGRAPEYAEAFGPPRPENGRVESSISEGELSEPSSTSSRKSSKKNSPVHEATDDDIPSEQRHFLSRLGLITFARLKQLKRRKSNRSINSTKNANFLYLERNNRNSVTKQRGWLNSQARPPQTRQKKARASPNPATSSSNSSSKSSNGPAKVGRPKSKSPPQTKPVKKQLAKQQQQQTSSITNGDVAKQEPKPSTSGMAQVLSNLPAGLTIERIDNDSSTVCITCRNPGTLTMCESCNVKFHVSCHTTSPASQTYCPNCVGLLINNSSGALELDVLKSKAKRNKSTAAATYSPRAGGTAGGDAELYKAPSGLYKSDAVEARQYLTAAALGINQLPSSTFLIPIDNNDDDNALGNRDVTVTAVDEPLTLVTSSTSFATLRPAATSAPSRLGYDVADQQQQSSILLNQLSQPVLSAAEQILSHGQSSLLVVPAQSRWQRRWSSDRPDVKPEVSLLSWADRASSVKEQHQQQQQQADDCEVTVEIICNNRTELIDQEQSDARSSPGLQEHIDDLDDAELRQREPEVFNVSSGSSEVQSIASPDQLPTGATENLDISIETIASSNAESDTTRQDCSDNGSNNENVADDSGHHNNLLGKVFPGNYGYKVATDSESPSTEDCDERRTDSEKLRESEGQRGHVKLEEAHLSAPLESDLITENTSQSESTTMVPDSEAMDVDEDKKNEEEENEDSGAERPNTVPDTTSNVDEDDLATGDGCNGEP